MADQMIRANGVEHCVESFGDESDPAILLVMGAGASMLHWPDAFCQALADGGRYVIRYDLRDTGRSTTRPPGEPDYELGDLVADAVAILDALSVDRAHLVGMSMGGMLCQLIALEHPARVASLTLYATTPGSPEHETADLPGPDARVLGALGEVDWHDPVAATTAILEEERLCAGGHGFDEEEWRERAARIVARTTDLASAANHFAMDGDERWRSRLGALRAPTLVLHGRDDPMFPLAHGLALAREIPGARLLELPGVGHEPPPAFARALIADAIVRHTGRA